MSYIEESLSSGEVIHKVFQLHWFAKVPMYCWLVLGLVTFGLTWLLALYEYFRLRSIEQGVTNKRVILKTGIISRHTEEMKLSSIETVSVLSSSAWPSPIRVSQVSVPSCSGDLTIRVL